MWAGTALPTLASAILCLSACMNGSGPVLRSTSPAAAVTPAAAGTDPVAAECHDLREEIRGNQEIARQAPSTSTEPEIVAATQGKAEQRVDDLRARYDELDCPPEAGTFTMHPREAPVQPAPGGASP
jgi:hypothetical protein